MIGSIGQIGELDRRIRIQALTPGQNSTYGEPTEAWTDWLVTWANVTPLTGRELYDARQLSAEVDTRFRVRWKSGLVPTMRILYDGKIYDIYHIAEIGRRVAWQILAKARQA